MDGGFTNNNPVLSSRCLLVSPFRLSRATDLHPRGGIAPWRAVFVPAPQEASTLFERGVEDAHAYLRALREGRTQLRNKQRWRDRLLGRPA